MRISPSDALVTEARSIMASGLEPGPARLVTTLEKPDGSYWYSAAVYRVGQDGTLDPARDAPESGDWRDPDPMAPVWAMRQVRRPTRPELSAGVEAQVVRLSLADAAGTTAQGEFTQRFLAPGVTRREIEHPELVGEVYFPAGKGPHPVVIGLNGSNGGMPSQRCALYAANGYIAVALAFFGAPGRPQYFGDTHLEYFETALAWARKEFRPQDDFIAVAGSSRGGELAMILAATFPEYVKAVIAFVPSAVVNGIQQAGKPGLPRDTPAWYYRGQPLPNLWQGNPDADVAAYTTPPGPGLPIRQDGAFIQAMKNREFTEQATIPVERIAGPVIMASAEDDGCWPSQLFCEMIERRLTDHGHPWPVEHVRNPLAGHSLMFPYLPISETVVTHPVSGLVMDFGGTTAVNAQACRITWDRITDFMRRAPQMYRDGERG